MKKIFRVRPEKNLFISFFQSRSVSYKFSCVLYIYMRNHYFFDNKQAERIGLLFDQQTTTVLYRTIISDVNATRKQKRESSLVFSTWVFFYRQWQFKR